MPDLDIYSDVILTHQEAKTGTTLLFKSHSEELHNINIKPNTEDEDEIKLEGKGKEHPDSGGKGDLYIIVNLISKRGRNNSAFDRGSRRCLGRENSLQSR